MGSGASKKSRNRYSIEEEEAAKKIQAGARGYLTRKRLKDDRRYSNERNFQKDLNSWDSGRQRDRQKTFGDNYSPRSRDNSRNRKNNLRRQSASPRRRSSRNYRRNKSADSRKSTSSTRKSKFGTTIKKEYKRWVNSSESRENRRSSPVNRNKDKNNYKGYNKSRVSPASADTFLMDKNRQKGGGNRRNNHKSKHRDSSNDKRHRDHSNNRGNRNKDKGKGKRRDSRESDSDRWNSWESGDSKLGKYGKHGRRPPDHTKPNSKLDDSATPPTWTQPPEPKAPHEHPMRVAGRSNKKGAPPPDWQLPQGHGNKSKYQSDFVHDYYW